MTKAKARLRAKAKAAQKGKKREAGTDNVSSEIRTGHYDPGASLKKSFGLDANTKSLGAARRGAARSR